MPFFILEADKTFAFFTLVSTTSTLLYMIGVYFNFKHLFTIWTLVLVLFGFEAPFIAR